MGRLFIAVGANLICYARGRRDCLYLVIRPDLATRNSCISTGGVSKQFRFTMAQSIVLWCFGYCGLIPH